MWTMCSTAFLRRLGPLLGLVLIASLFAGLYPHDHATAWGALIGGLVAMGIMLLVRLRKSDNEGTITRAMRGTPDERDKALTHEAGTWTAIAMQIACALGLVALAWHANAMIVIGAILWIGLITQYGSYLILQRRR